MDEQKTTAPLIVVVDEAYALFGGMTGHGKNAELLQRILATGMPIYVGDSKGRLDFE